MEQIKKNLAVKITAFVLLQFFVLVTVFSAAVVIFNVSQGWYSKDEESVRAEIFTETADFASGEIIDRYVNYGSQELERFFSGLEEDAVNFGYAIYEESVDANGTISMQGKPLRQLHGDLKNGGDVYQNSYDFESYGVEIYLRAPQDGTTGFPDEIASFYGLQQNLYQYRIPAVIAGSCGLAGAIALFVFLMVSAGCGRKNSGEILKMIPLDLGAVVAGVILAVLLSAVTSIQFGYEFDASMALAIFIVLGASIVISGFLTIFAARAKQGAWWRSTIIYLCLRLLRRLQKAAAFFIRQIPVVWKTAAAALIFFFLIVFMAPQVYYNGFFLFFIAVLLLAACVLAVYTAMCFKRLKEGAEKIAQGDLAYQIDKKGLFWDLSDHADTLNHIRIGISRAVEERTKSERFKAELITNVSHDIKTPLTSIINYVDFLKKEELGSEKAQEYVEVLDRQSSRLKKLTEDLVDASKAATGNIKMELAPCQVGVLLEQTIGEYEEKAENCKLKFVTKLPDKELEIMADGRRLWRVFDNLLNNICKYSQPETRVYLNLEETDGQAVITWRNTSRYELNLTEEELTERFVRGDRSRHTEGSGLGLSIARNLVKLQGGSFRVVVDGDLFKVILKFPLIEE